MPCTAALLWWDSASDSGIFSTIPFKLFANTFNIIVYLAKSTSFSSSSQYQLQLKKPSYQQQLHSGPQPLPPCMQLSLFFFTFSTFLSAAALVSRVFYSFATFSWAAALSLKTAFSISFASTATSFIVADWRWTYCKSHGDLTFVALSSTLPTS